MKKKNRKKIVILIYLKVSYPSGVTVSLGNELTPTQVKDVPQVSWEAEKGAYYTLLMTDPGNIDDPSHHQRFVFVQHVYILEHQLRKLLPDIKFFWQYRKI